MIQSRTGEGDRAIQRAQGVRVVPFDAERLPTVVTLGTGCNKGCGRSGMLLVEGHMVPIWLQARL